MPDPNCPYCHGYGWVKRTVPVSDPSFGKAFPCRCTVKERAARRSKRLQALSGTEQTGYMTFDSFRADKCVGDQKRMASLKTMLQGWAVSPKGWVVLEGPYGTGKTHLAYAVANRMLELGKAVHIASMPELLKTLREGIGDKKVDANKRLTLMEECDTLIVDDLGTENQTGWAIEQIFLIFNHRYTNRMPMLITTNESLTAKDCKIDPRIKSRLSE